MGRPFSSLGVVPSQLELLLATAKELGEVALSAGEAQMDTQLKHKYADPVEVNLMLEMGGAGEWAVA